jgi:glycosyltransferase involved in cell wall biosynthesis
MDPLRQLMNDFSIDFYITSFNGSVYKSFIEDKDSTLNVTSLPYDKLTKAAMSNLNMRRVLISRAVFLDTSIKPILFKTVLKNKYDIVETVENYTYSSFQSVITKKILKTHTVIMNWENIVFPPWRYPLRYIVNKQCDAFRVPSLTAKWKLLREGVKNEQIHYIPACVDTKRFNPYLNKNLKKELGIEDKTIVLYIGRLVLEKGVDYLIKAFSKVLQKDSKAILVIVGEGPLKNELYNLVNELKIKDHVIFLKAVPYSRIHKIHAISDITVLPSIPTKSWMEQFGYVLIEAMACGKPVVASRCGAIPEIVIDNETGFLVEPGNINELTEKISLLISDNKLRETMGYKGRIRVERKFSYEAVIPKIKELYYSISK